MNLYGLAEFATAAGVRRELFAQWRHRGKIPEPFQTLRSGPVWTEQQVTRWISAQRKEAS